MKTRVVGLSWNEKMNSTTGLRSTSFKHKPALAALDVPGISMNRRIAWMPSELRWKSSSWGEHLAFPQEIDLSAIY